MNAALLRTGLDISLSQSWSLSLSGALSGSAAQCPFSIEPAECVIPPKSTKEFKLTFLPLDADDFVYLLTGDTTGTGNGMVRKVVGQSVPAGVTVSFAIGQLVLKAA